MNRWKAIVSPQTVNLLSSPGIQVQSSALMSSRCQDREQSREQRREEETGRRGNLWLTVGTATAATALALKFLQEKDSFLLHAKEAKPEITPEQLSFDNRVRQFSPPDQIFNYFSSIQLVSSSGQKTVMMSPMDFYSSITPDCSIHPGAGSGIYEEISEERLPRTRLEKSPFSESVLNKIGLDGLISYNDYCFLLALLATPVKFVETAFHVFDVTGDGNIDVKEFAYVSTALSHKVGGYGSYTDKDQADLVASPSGLLNYMFGKNRDKSFTKSQFIKLQQDLLDEIIHVEFNEYDPDNSGRISELDFCEFLLKKSKVPPAMKARMLKRIKQIYPTKARGISYPSFKNFFQVLAAGAELERSLFFLDVENIGVSLEEFRRVSSWVSKCELSDHVAEVVFVLLDDQGQGRIFKETLGPLIYDWRQPRGFDKSSLKMKLGNLKI